MAGLLALALLGAGATPAWANRRSCFSRFETGAIRARVEGARRRQRRHFEGTALLANADTPALSPQVQGWGRRTCGTMVLGMISGRAYPARQLWPEEQPAAFVRADATHGERRDPMKAQRLFVSVLLVGLLMALAGSGQRPARVAAKPAHPLARSNGDKARLDATPATAPGVSADWWATVQETIRQSEYHVTWQEQTYLPDLPAAYQAPNRANNLRTYFSPINPVVIPRIWHGTSTTPPWRWQVSLTAWGPKGAVQPVSPATIQVEENRVEYRRESLVEWYRNDERDNGALDQPSITLWPRTEDFAG
jgi:hypothetical protein